MQTMSYNSSEASSTLTHDQPGFVVFVRNVYYKYSFLTSSEKNPVILNFGLKPYTNNLKARFCTRVTIFFKKHFHWFVLKCTAVIVTNMSHITCKIVIWLFPYAVLQTCGLSMKFTASNATCWARVLLPKEEGPKWICADNPCFKMLWNGNSRKH